MKHLQTLKEFLFIALAMAIATCAVFFFLVPSGVTIGSISGLALVLTKFLPLPMSAVTMILNVTLLVLGLLLVGVEFTKRTILASLLLPIYLGVLERLFPDFTSFTADPLLDMVGYIMVVCVAMAILFHLNASSGGLDIVSKILNVRFRMDLGTAVIVTGMAVAVSSVLVSEPKLVFLSVLGTYFQGLILDHFLLGFHVKKRVCILSKKETEIRNFILHEIHSGATIYEAIGAYSDEPHREIVAILHKNEYQALMKFLSQTDPDAFVTVYNVNEVLYKPKPRG